MPREAKHISATIHFLEFDHSGRRCQRLLAMLFAKRTNSQHLLIINWPGLTGKRCFGHFHDFQSGDLRRKFQEKGSSPFQKLVNTIQNRLCLSLRKKALSAYYSLSIAVVSMYYYLSPTILYTIVKVHVLDTTAMTLFCHRNMLLQGAIQSTVYFRLHYCDPTISYPIVKSFFAPRSRKLQNNGTSQLSTADCDIGQWGVPQSTY